MSKKVYSVILLLILTSIFINPKFSFAQEEETCDGEHVIGEVWAGDCSSTLGFRAELTCNDELTITTGEREDLTCGTSTLTTPSPSLNSGTCTVVRVLNGPRGGVRKEIRDNCVKPGYRPEPIYGTTDRCNCVSDTTPSCPKNGSDCNLNDPNTCQAFPGCSNFVCSPAGRGGGRCENPSTSCTKENRSCSKDADCQTGGACSQFTCWTVGKDKQCRFGTPPAPTTKQCKPTTAPGFGPTDKACTSGGGINCDTNGLATAIGCIHTQPTTLVKDVLKFMIGIAGGIAFLLMVLGAFEMITSAGNPESLQAGKDRFRDAIIGLLFIVFAVLLLKIIGVDILGLGTFLGIP